MILKPLSIEDMETVREWRHEVAETLRTPYMLTREQQEDYYRNVICDRRSTTRYWGLWKQVPPFEGTMGWAIENERGGTFIGYGGIENISWENSIGEMSLLIGPDFRERGYGREAVSLFLDQAFNYLNLENVNGECYQCGPWQFWGKVLRPYQAFFTWLPNRKFWNGEYHDSLYFNVERQGYLYHTCPQREQTDSGEEHQGLRREADNGVLDRDGEKVGVV